MVPCRLRPLTEDDVAMILPWRNHPDVRRFMYTQHEISPQEHADFFARALRDTTRAYYLGLDGEEPVGVVSLRDIDRDHGTASWGFYVRPRVARGTGRRMLTPALDEAFVRHGLAKLSGEALGFNRASIRLHLGLGFAIEGVLHAHRWCGGRRHDVVRMAMHASHWTAEHKDWLGRTREARSRTDAGDAAMVYRAHVADGLVPLVVNHLTAVAGPVVSLHIDVSGTGAHLGAVELTLHCVHRDDTRATYDVKVVAPDGMTLAGGYAHVVIAKEAA